MLKEERKKKSKKSWKKTSKWLTNNWSGEGRKNRLSDFDEEKSPRIRKKNKKNRINWQEFLMEDEYDLNDG